MMKTATATKLLLLGLVLSALGLGVRFVGVQTSPQRVRATVLKQLNGALDAGINVDSARFSFKGTLRADGVTITPKGRDEAALACRQIMLGFDMAELLRLRTVVEKATLVKPTFRLIHRQGAWNFEAIRLKSREGPARDARAFAQGLHVENGTIIVGKRGLFGDDEPRTFPGLYLSMTPDPRDAREWRYQGEFRNGPLQGVRISGQFASGPEPRLSVRFSAEGLPVDRKFWQAVPFGKPVWHYTQLEGRLALAGSLNVSAEGALSYSFTFHVRDGRARTRFFPAALSSVCGTVAVTERDIIIKDISGIIPAYEFGLAERESRPAHVRVSGTLRHSKPGGAYKIEAFDVPLCRRSVEAIPATGPELWDRLKPAGRCGLTVTLTEPADGGHTDFTVIGRLQNVTLRPRELPWTLQEVGGTLVADNEGVRLQRISGLLFQEDGREPGGAAHVTADGLVDFGGRNTSVRISALNIRADEELVTAIPGCGEQIWEMCRPEARLDLSVLLRNGVGPEELTHDVAVRLHGGKARLAFWPMPLGDLTGTLRIVGDKVFVENLSVVLNVDDGPADHMPSTRTMEVTGTIDLGAEHIEIYLPPSDLILTEKFVRSIPEVGDDIWSTIRPEGPASVSGKIFYHGRDQTALHYALTVDLKDVSLLLEAEPFQITGLCGKLLVSDVRSFSNNLFGFICGGRFDCAAVLNYGAKGEHPTYGASVRFSQIDLKQLVQTLSGGQKDVAGQLSGTVDIGGIHGKENCMSGKGKVTLTEGDMWRTPFFVSLLDVLRLSIPVGHEASGRGEMTFTLSAAKAAIRQFDLTDGGLNLSGYGTVGLDGKLDLTMAAIGAPENRVGIPLLSPAVGWLLRGVERQLFRLEVSGTLDDPVFKSQVLRTIAWPLTSLHSLFFSPIFGTSKPPQK